MKIHKEGIVTLILVLILILIVDYITITIIHNLFITCILLPVTLVVFLFFVYFFRTPNRQPVINQQAIIAPCDGKVVVIEKVTEDEVLKSVCTQVSIFMSPLNVHINWFPVNGKIVFMKMHWGSHLVAWAPKSSTHNERSTVVIETENQIKILVRQIAGAVARRVVCYAREGEKASQNGQLGFIKFGSRVDLFLPDEYEICVDLEQKVTGSQTIIARLKNDRK